VAGQQEPGTVARALGASSRSRARSRPGPGRGDGRRRRRTSSGFSVPNDVRSIGTCCFSGHDIPTAATSRTLPTWGIVCRSAGEETRCLDGGVERGDVQPGEAAGPVPAVAPPRGDAGGEDPVVGPGERRAAVAGESGPLRAGRLEHHAGLGDGTTNDSSPSTWTTVVRVARPLRTRACSWGCPPTTIRSVGAAGPVDGASLVVGASMVSSLGRWSGDRAGQQSRGVQRCAGLRPHDGDPGRRTARRRRGSRAPCR